MFKSIQWKVLTVFILLIISVLVVVSTFLLNSISSYYYDEFKNQMEQMVFISDLTGQLGTAVDAEDPPAALRTVLDLYIGRMGVDSFRNYYILTGDTAETLYSSGGAVGSTVMPTQNILTAMAGTVGGAVDKRAAVMDYAYPLTQNNSVRYIIYVSDTKEELYGIMTNIFSIIFWALILGIGISVVLGLILSRTIIAPIASLKKRAEKIAAGDFENPIAVRSADEIGQLGLSFNTMAADLKRTMADIAAEKNKVETILTYMADGVMAFYRDGSVMHINPAAQEMLSIGAEGEPFDSLFARLGVNLSINTLLYLDANKTPERTIVTDTRHIKAFFAPFMPRRGIAEGVVVVLQDVTEQQKLDTARREFVANVSHELRTPLTTVKSYAETLAENAEPQSMEFNFLEIINSEADRMTRIVKDLLTLSQLDYDKTVLHKSPFALPQMVENVVKRLAMEAKRREQQLSFTNDATDMTPLNGDKDRIEQVVVNIVSNAIKYTPNGGSITVSCAHRYTDAVVIVSDTGIGIPKEDLPRIFERFYRVDKARSRKLGGTGLGLAIAREIVEAHGGTIRIDSVKGKGTTVTIQMPIYGEKG